MSWAWRWGDDQLAPQAADRQRLCQGKARPTQKLRYIITPEGLALRAALTVNYIKRLLNSIALSASARRLA